MKPLACRNCGGDCRYGQCKGNGPLAATLLKVTVIKPPVFEPVTEKALSKLTTGRVKVHSAMEPVSPNVEIHSRPEPNMSQKPVTETNKRDMSRKPGRPKKADAMTPAERKRRQRSKA